MTVQLDKNYWSGKYQNNLTGWDAGAVTTPIKTYIDQLSDKSVPILIPGCGFGHEAAYLYDHGFNNVTVIDLAPEPIAHLKDRCPNWSDDNLIVGNFFDHNGQYDIIFEQTFFCALNPEMRPAYASKATDLLSPGGKLVGVLFNISIPGPNPPYGGSADEYKLYFDQLFEFETYELCYNSIKPREGTELFINLRKKSQS
jgi:SAM-dependent methyltransferase